MEVIEVVDLSTAQAAVLALPVGDRPSWQVRIKLSSAELITWYTCSTTEIGNQKIERFRKEVPELYCFHRAILDLRVAASKQLSNAEEVRTFILEKAQSAFDSIFSCNN